MDKQYSRKTIAYLFYFLLNHFQLHGIYKTIEIHEHTDSRGCISSFCLPIIFVQSVCRAVSFAKNVIYDCEYCEATGGQNWAGQEENENKKCEEKRVRHVCTIRII